MPFKPISEEEKNRIELEIKRLQEEIDKRLRGIKNLKEIIEQGNWYSENKS
jgi:hypothetical protein